MKLTPINPHFTACDQQWEYMPIQEEGRLCEACERVLVDFTPLSDVEMLNLHRNSNSKLCGRYTKGQVDRLHRHMVTEEANARPWLVSLAMGVGAALPFTLAAQQPIGNSDLLIGDTILFQQPLDNIELPATQTQPKPPSNVKIPLNYTVPLPGLPGEMRYPKLVVENTTTPITVLDAVTLKPIPFAVIETEEFGSFYADTNGIVIVNIPKEKLRVGINAIAWGPEHDNLDFVLNHERKTLRLGQEMQLRLSVLGTFHDPRKFEKRKSPATIDKAMKRKLDMERKLASKGDTDLGLIADGSTNHKDLRDKGGLPKPPTPPNIQASSDSGLRANDLSWELGFRPSLRQKLRYWLNPTNWKL